MMKKRPRKVKMLPIVLPWALTFPVALFYYSMILRTISPDLPNAFDILPVDILFYPLFAVGNWFRHHGIELATLGGTWIPWLMLMFLWLVLVGAAFGFVHYAIRRFIWPKRHKRPDVCATCGYSLQGLPEPRCPECGREFDPAIQTSYEDHRR